MSSDVAIDRGRSVPTENTVHGVYVSVGVP